MSVYKRNIKQFAVPIREYQVAKAIRIRRILNQKSEIIKNLTFALY
ncbi:unnamed protein product [Paramecium octaurelia]|uniref:Uncharacterized protein n=1 Tax=Paramecium octaurelia TaxID=43137 RepID=A0A8S1YC00_PAROT|nr:unnamed protein product [Paramecium octaurelia]